MRILHLGGRIFAIPGIERRGALARVAEHERHLADGDDRETARLIAGVDVSDVGDVVARHVVMIERLAELLRWKDRDLDRAAGGLGDILAPRFGRTGQRVRGRNPEREPEVDLLVLSEGGSGDSERKSECERRRRAESASGPKACADRPRARSISACLLPRAHRRCRIISQARGADRQARRARQRRWAGFRSFCSSRPSCARDWRSAPG